MDFNLPPLPPVVSELANTSKRINIRAKGQRGEREVVKLLQAVIDAICIRHNKPSILLQRNQLQTWQGGDDLHGLDWLAVEVKFQETESLGEWWRQAVRQAEAKNALPVLFYRASKQKWKVRFRAYVSTPLERDQIEMDLDTNIDDFIEWFGNSFEERLLQ